LMIGHRHILSYWIIRAFILLFWSLRAIDGWLLRVLGGFD
jgi:hypothetical protein